MASYRVLRGPDWEGGEDDGGEGHLGTITELLCDGRVRVLWDKGQESTCRAGADGKFDLRIFDTGQSGIRHPNTKCQECGEENIYGVLWRCKVCVGKDLCSKCYSEDKHDIGHRFLRIDSFKSDGKEVKQRKTSVKMRAMGIFEGSKVTRGKHWIWEDQDGGPGTQGEMQAFENVALDSTRNLVRVAWPNGVLNSYRLGFQGQVDLTCVEEEIGPFYYRDHLQLMDSSEIPLALAPVEAYTSSLPATSTLIADTCVSPSSTASAAVVTTSLSTTTASVSQTSSSSGRSCESASSKGSYDKATVFAGNEFPRREDSRTAVPESVIEEDELLLVGDKVIIGVDEERLVKLQQKFGGCTKGMISRIGAEGVVTAVPSLQTPAVSVKYTEKQSYRLNPAVLVKITSFTEGDVVRVRRDVQQVMFLNKSVGWSETMEKACGKVGRIRAVDSSYSVTVRLGSQELKFHASCLMPALGAPLDDVKSEEQSIGNALGDVFTNVTRGADSSSDSGLLMRLLGLAREGGSGDNDSDPRVRQLFYSIQRGDSGTVRRMIETDRGLLTAVYKDVTPLGYASHVGRTGVMDTLLELGADLECRDPKRRTPLLTAVEGKEQEAAFYLIDKGANVNASNRKHQTPLHFAAIRDMPEVIQRLILYGADVNATDSFGDSPLSDAINQGKEQAIEALLRVPALNKHALNGKGFNMLQQACLRGVVRAVELMLELEDHPHVDDRLNGEFTALHIAANNDHVECIGLLILLGGATVDHGDGRRQLTPLHLACRKGQFMSAKCLIEMGANVNATDIYGNTPLHLAVGKLPEEDRGSEGSDRDLTADERIRIACLLIDNGTLIDAFDYSGRTPMDFAPTAVQKAIQQYIDEQTNAVMPYVSSDVTQTLTAASDPCPSSTTIVTGDSEDSGTDLTSPIPGLSNSCKQHDAVLMQDLLKGVSLQCARCDHLSDVTLQPCGHKSVCRKCADTVTCCPVCDVHIEEKEVDNTDDENSEGKERE